MMDSSAIGITGLGILCAIGNDAAAVKEALLQRKSGIGPLRYLASKHRDLPVGEVSLSNDQMKAMLGLTADCKISRTSLMGALAIRQALSQAGIQTIKGKRVALISGTTVGGMDLTERYYGQMQTDDSLLFMPYGNECGKSTQEMAQIAGLENIETCTISTACSAALNALIVGAEMLKHDEADIVIAGGSEALSKFHLNGFNTLMILDKALCRPFDDTRAGLNLGEGAAFVVMERDAANSLAYVAGYGNRCDAFHQTASSENGEGAYLAMQEALACAGLEAKAIQYVNAHGTGTQNNDLSESQALKRVFGRDLPAVSSTKSFTGHTTSASGAIESVICILAMQYDFIPANLGWKHPIAGGITPTLGQEGVRLEHVMCNAFGFGGNDSSMVFCRHRPKGNNACVPDYAFETVAEEVVTEVSALSALREFMDPMATRRMGKLMKAAHLVASRALKSAGIACPDAIVTATARGMLDTSMQFLEDILESDEEHLKPTLFMQSTHNTLGSAIAISTRCHGYNITYSHGTDSFAWAMRDAVRLLRTGKARSVLVGCFDEATPAYVRFAERAGAEVPAEIYAKAVVLKRK